MQNLFTHPFIVKIKTFVLRHKIMSAIALGVIAYGGYKLFLSGDSVVETRYVLAAAEKGTIISSVTGSGQVAAENQLEIKPKVSGQLTFVGVKPGQTVKKGQVLFRLNARDALKGVRDAETNLETAELALAKLKEPPESASLLAAENAIANAEADKKSQDTTVANALRTFLNTGLAVEQNGTIPGLETPTLSGSYGGTIKGQYAISVYYTNSGLSYSVSGLGSASGSITPATALVLGDGLYITFPDVENLSGTSWVVNVPNMKATSYTSNMNAYNTALENRTKAIASADRTIAEQNQKIADLRAGADALDLRAKELSVEQARNALQDAREKLLDYTLVAPFDGVIASVEAAEGDPTDTTNSGTALATLITQEKMATISLNEVDAAKVSVGKKATLSFDAIEGLTFTGVVSQVDAIGTVSQGVVTYNVKISFDTQDDRVKSGMSISAAIVSDVRQDALIVPLGAVKFQNGASYVDLAEGESLSATSSSNQGVPLAVPPRSVEIEVGLTNDTEAEITSGLKEGNVIVVKMLTTGAAAAKPAQSVSLFGGGGGNVRRVGG